MFDRIDWDIFWQVVAALTGLAVLSGAAWALWHYPLLRFWLWSRPRMVLNLLCLLTAFAVAAGYLWNCQRTTGHVTCDFAGQWLMGRMLVQRQGHMLYLFDRKAPDELDANPQYQPCDPQYEALAGGYNPTDCREMYRDLITKRRNHGNELEGPNHKIEGPLYPPTAALLMMPVSLMDPRTAYLVLVVVYLLCGFAAGWLIRWGSAGRLWWGEASLLVMAFPNYAQAVLLGQNSPLTMLILVAGWALWARRWPFFGGLVWGLLAYKPVFAVAVIWVPILLLSWRMLLGMILSGAAFCLLTLPFLLPPAGEKLAIPAPDPTTAPLRHTVRQTLGERFDAALQPWRRWYQVGHNAKRIYDADVNWVWMSRDLYSLPRRKMYDPERFRAHVEFLLYDEHRFWHGEFMQATQAGEVELYPGYKVHVNCISWGLLGFVFGGTVLVIAANMVRRIWRAQPLGYAPVGPRIAFLLFGSLLTTFHFIHYDLLVFALPFALLVADIGRRGIAYRAVLLTFALAILACSVDISGVGRGSVRLPVETYLLLLLWMWTGLLTLAERLPLLGRADSPLGAQDASQA